MRGRVQVVAVFVGREAITIRIHHTCSDDAQRIVVARAARTATKVVPALLAYAVGEAAVVVQADLAIRTADVAAGCAPFEALTHSARVAHLVIAALSARTATPVTAACFALAIRLTTATFETNLTGITANLLTQDGICNAYAEATVGALFVFRALPARTATKVVPALLVGAIGETTSVLKADLAIGTTDVAAGCAPFDALADTGLAANLLVAARPARTAATVGSAILSLAVRLTTATLETDLPEIAANLLTQDAIFNAHTDATVGALFVFHALPARTAAAIRAAGHALAVGHAGILFSRILIALLPVKSDVKYGSIRVGCL